MKRKCSGLIVDDPQLHGNLKGGHIYGFSQYSAARKNPDPDKKGISIGCRHLTMRGECSAGMKHMLCHHRGCLNAKLG